MPDNKKTARDAKTPRAAGGSTTKRGESMTAGKPKARGGTTAKKKT
jgi:hypothetical protein